ncbi:uncharacterized protein LOC110367697 isoform X9 [Fundulus heteroclitus]|uniref:uncharacterized protein LOC110367697 isoform X9 n=1 Tax=Fundulus heteroclitus TaxID=8078 RepID=UPI00165BAD84|nr:uncharacterized protein LOC110367697 isoform X9 [Fundulus heteroclitus]
MSFTTWKVVADQFLTTEERNAGPDQKSSDIAELRDERQEPEPAEMIEAKEEPEPQSVDEKRTELGSSEDEGQLSVKQETDSLILSPTVDQKDFSEAEPVKNNFLCSTGPKDEKPEKRCKPPRKAGDRVVNSALRRLKKKSPSCEACGRCFYNRQKFIVHMRSHTVDFCKNRWRNLRDVFVRNNKRIQLPSGSSRVPKTEWKNRRLMSFLLPYMLSRRSKNRLHPAPTGDLEEGQSGTPLSLAEKEEQPGTPSPSTTPSPSSEGDMLSPSPRETPPRRPERRNTGKPVEDRIVSVLENLSPTNTDEESYYFALSTVPILSKLSSQRKRRAKREIMQILDDLTDEQEVQQTDHQARISVEGRKQQFL